MFIFICYHSHCRYLKLYGLKFSKEDHIKLIKLLLSLIEIPDLEPAKLNKFCIALSQLLRYVSNVLQFLIKFVAKVVYFAHFCYSKSSWLSPEDIEIDWKPLYKLSNIFLNKNSTKGEIYRYFP